MEPTIYKPSIYKGAGIYKTGAEGGGDCVEISGKLYQTKKIGDKIWITSDLEYIDNNIVVSSALTSSPCCLGRKYNYGACVYLTNNQNSLFGEWRIATREDYEDLINNFSADDVIANVSGGQNSAGINFVLDGFFDTSLVYYGVLCILDCASTDYDTPLNVMYLNGNNSLFEIGEGYTKNLFRGLRLCKDA